MVHASLRCGQSRAQAGVEKLARDERAAMTWSAFSFDGNRTRSGFLRGRIFRM
jgi:hypothetical protein